LNNYLIGKKRYDKAKRKFIIQRDELLNLLG